MAHNIWNDEANGVDAMWCVGDREAAWHRLGQRTADAQNWQAAMKLAGLDWDVSKIQLLGALKGKPQPVESWGIFRKTDGAFLGAVGPSYTPIQNRTAFDFVDTLLEAQDGAHYESAGALGKGERIWTLARVPYDIKIKGTDDKSLVYLLFTTAHDGSQAATCKLSTVRVVCMNTLNAALSGVGAAMKIRHTKDAAVKMLQAQKAMTGVMQDAKQLEEKLNLLASRRLTKETMLTVLDRLFPKPVILAGDDAAAGKVAAATRRDNVVLAVLKLFEKNDDNRIPEIRGTAYNLLNAVTEYTDHERQTRILTEGQTPEQARAVNSMFGTGADFKSDALDTILTHTADSPTHSRQTYGGGVAVAEAIETTSGLSQTDVDAEVERILRAS